MVERWVVDAANGSRYFTVQDVSREIADGGAQLWIVWGADKPQAICVTQISTSSKGKYCSIWIMTGDGRESWQDLIGELEEWARHEGCKFMRNEARPGWTRIMKPFGYEHTHSIIEKDL